MNKPPADLPEISAVTDFLGQCLPFDQLQEDTLLAVARRLEIRYFRRGQRFMADPENNEGLRILRSGAVEIFSEDGQLLDRLGEGESFNIAGLAEEHSGVKALLIEDSLVYRLPEKDYQGLREKHRDFDRFFHRQRSRRLRRAARYQPDTNAMMRPLAGLVTRDVLSVTSNTSIQDTARAMNERRVSSIMIVDNDELAGIVTDRDLRSRAIAEGLSVTEPVSAVMTANPHCIALESTVFDATLMMTELGCHHLPVMENGKLTGVVTASDLMLAKQDDPVYLVQHVSRQRDVTGMKNVVAMLPNIVKGWVRSGVRVDQLSRILTAISDAITQRLITMSIEELGPAPAEFAWLGFGSQGRCEQLIGADQDNGLLISDDLNEADRDWFKQLATRVCDGLNECGYVYCPGDVMATNDAWRQTLAGWKETVDSWTRAPTPDAVMRVSIFFDIRVIYGSQQLGKDLQQHMLANTQQSSIFLAALAGNVLEHTPPLGVFRRFIVERSGEHRDTLDLKKRGVIPIIDMVRIHSLARGIEAVNTHERIAALAERKVLNIGDSRNLQDAFDFIQQLRVENQAAQLERGEKASNHCNPHDLPELSRNHLRDAFTIVHDSQQAIKQKYRAGMG
jgi:CBS domain-containing protein